MRVLIVEDEKILADAIAAALRRQGFVVDIAASGPAALDGILPVRYDAIVLDRRLPGGSGDEICCYLAGQEDRPRILMLTAAADVRDRVAGLDLGADDYLAKPAALDEVCARVRALLRRPARARPMQLCRGDLVLDPGPRRAWRAGRLLRLTPKQFAVLEILMEADGRVVSSAELLDRAWDANADPFTAAVRVTMAGLRRALADPDVIETLPGSGYRL
jgi:DNA-binding response OmpR family regulator